MEVVLLPSAAGPGPGPQFLTTVVVDGVLAVDAGCLGLWPDLAAQAAVRHVVLTHPHADHVCSLPLFLENVYGLGPPPRVLADAATLAAVRADLFNDRTFPDLISRPPPGGPFVELDELPPGTRRHVGRHAVTAVPVAHPVPTSAVLVEGPGAAVLVVTDTGPTDDVWRLAAAVPDLKLVLLEATFPNAERRLADASGHLTPAQFAAEAAKAPPAARVLAVHLKPRFRDAIVRELGPAVEVMEPGRVYVV